MKEQIIKSSGNVFADLGFDTAEASILQMRSKLMNDLRSYIESNKLNIILSRNRNIALTGIFFNNFTLNAVRMPYKISGNCLLPTSNVI